MTSARRLEADDRRDARRPRGCGRARSGGRPRRGRAPSPGRRRGRRSRAPCLTAARFVTAPPMPTKSSGVGRPSSRASSAAIASNAAASVSSETAPSRPKRSVKRDGADVEAEPLVDVLAVTERELRAAAAGVEDDERARADPEPGRSRRGRRAGPPPRRRSPRSRRRSAPARRRGSSALLGASRSPAVPTAAIASAPSRPASATIAAIASTVRSIGSASSRPASSSPSPRRVTSARSTIVRHSPSGRALADVELDRVRADVDDRVAPRAEAGERLQAASEAHVAPASRGRARARRRSRRAGSSDSTAIVRAEPCVGPHLGQLRHAAADRVALPPLVHRDGAQVVARLDHARRGARRACTRCARAPGRRRRARRAPRATSAAESGNAAFMTGFHCSSPSSFDALELLDVHQPVANLDRRVARAREQVDLVALLNPLGRRARRSGSSASPKRSPNVRHSQRGTIGGVVIESSS